MYVIQGQTIAEAEAEIEWAIASPTVIMVGFPRVVHYYGDPVDSEALGKVRCRLIEHFFNRLVSAGMRIHILGMNSFAELRFAAELGMSIDSRIASLLAVAGLQVDPTHPLNRPKGLRVDILQHYSVETLELIETNVFTLNDFFDSLCPKNPLT